MFFTLVCQKIFIFLASDRLEEVGRELLGAALASGSEATGERPKGSLDGKRDRAVRTLSRSAGTWGM